MHYCQVCDDPHLMVPGQGVAQCPSCGSIDPVASTRPLFVVTGASGSGKTTLLPLLLDRLAGRCAVFDADWLIDPLARAAPDGRYDLLDAWLHVAHGLAQNGLATVLLGPFFPGQLDGKPARAWIGETHYLVLDCPDDERRRRIEARPCWRSRDIAEQIDFGRWLRASLAPVADTDEMTAAEVADVVAAWVHRRMLRRRSPRAGDPAAKAGRPSCGIMSGIPVNVDNFARAETDRMFAAVQAGAGGVNRWLHYRVPTPLDQQTVIRMNRDTLYSAAVVDISAGASVTIPDAGRRYVSVMIVNQDHYVNAVFHDPGEHMLTIEQFGTPYVLAAVRVLVDPAEPADVAAVNALQDRLGLEARSARSFVPPDYDQASLAATRAALLELGKGLHGFQHAFGANDEVNPVRHLIATAGAWGGLPDYEAIYLNVNPGLPPGAYQLTVREVPVDGFWSISLYNAAGYFEPNDSGAYSVNNITATRNGDGSVTVHFGGCGDGRPNCLPIMDGWNYLVRLYRPRAEILDGTWAFPSIEPSS